MSLQGKAVIGRKVVEALSEFEARPGRYSLVMREPGVLFDNARAVLTLALGRPVPELYIDATQAASTQASARFFVRAAFLRNGADHYTTMGLWPGFSEAELRDQYRLLMRLTHPDFVAGDPSWPADAATRVNKAYEILSSPTLKAEYDRTLNQGATGRPMPAWHTRAQPSRADAYRAPTPSWVWASGAGVAVVLGGLWAFFHDWGPPVEVVSMNMEEFSASAAKRPSAATPPVSPLPPVTVAQAPASVTTVVPESVAATPPLPIPAPALPSQPVQVAVAPTPAAIPVEMEKPRRKTAQELRQEREEKRRLEAEQRRALALARVQAQSQIQPPAQPKAPVQVAVAGQAVPALVPAPVPVVAPAQAVVPAPAPVPATAAVPPPVQAAAPQVTPAPRLTVADIQPSFLVLLQGMQTGNPDAITRGLDRSVRQSDSTAHLLRVYKHLVGDANPIRVGQVQLRGRADGEQFVVDGLVQLLLPETGSSAPVRELRMKAVFVRQAGQIVVTQLAVGG